MLNHVTKPTARQAIQAGVNASGGRPGHVLGSADGGNNALGSNSHTGMASTSADAYAAINVSTERNRKGRTNTPRTIPKSDRTTTITICAGAVSHTKSNASSHGKI